MRGGRALSLGVGSGDRPPRARASRVAKLIITDSEHETESPFLRGILTRSLQEAGLSFERAYGLSSKIRQSLLREAREADHQDPVEFTARQVQARVIRALRKAGLKDTVARYRSRHLSAVPLTVRHTDGQVTPFSRAYHRRELESSGLVPEEATSVTADVYEHLLEHGEREVTSAEIDHLTHRHLDAQLGPAVARRYLVWRDFVLSGRPLLLLIGGAAGSGKSTIATAIASRLGIVRTQSTDMLREVMRVMMPERLLPVLHRSSFDAWRAVARAETPETSSDELLVDGYRAQADLIAVACEAVMNRALRERVSLILEGVHVLPSLVDELPGDTDALVVPIMLGVLKAKTLRGRIRGRGGKAPARRSARYLEAFDNIWRLQSYLLSEADRAGIPIVRNNDVDQVCVEVMKIILDRLEKNFSQEPEDVFRRPHVRPFGLVRS